MSGNANMHESTFTRCSEFVDRYLASHEALSIADVGSYDVNGTYRSLFARPGWTYTGLDLSAGPNVDVVLKEPEHWASSHSELKERFDVVISGQTLEHVRRPWIWICQVACLCKPGGLIWLCAPNTWEFHKFPIDCWRIWPDGMRGLFQQAGLDEVACWHDGPDTMGIARKPIPICSMP
jgi:2-polyprenyl-3-methyl-5-hydroxy-6-metoxy-1,4-benzoquinol methylase